MGMASVPLACGHCWGMLRCSSWKPSLCCCCGGGGGRLMGGLGPLGPGGPPKGARGGPPKGAPCSGLGAGPGPPRGLARGGAAGGIRPGALLGSASRLWSICHLHGRAALGNALLFL